VADACQEWLEGHAAKVYEMIKVLIFIKHRIKFLWTLIDRINAVLFSVLFGSRLRKVVPRVFGEHSLDRFTFRTLHIEDVSSLYNLIRDQDPVDLRFFQPHGFDLDALGKQTRKRSFLMMGVFDGESLIGYFFLRFFFNRKCFVGRLIDKKYRGTGIGKVMNRIMYEIAWEMKFRCLSTISRQNKLVMNAHAGNTNMIVLKELRDNYLLVEFVREAGEDTAVNGIQGNK
jgi:RimJ/RimL family protein N-acetyltransferase